MNKPCWLNKRVDLVAVRPVKELIARLGLHTVCQESLCPNISECFDSGVATFMILGNRCTRGCQFCALTKSPPLAVDHSEPLRVRQAVETLGLNYVVITSPTRDDLADKGVEAFIETVNQIKGLNPSPGVEVLIPDFAGCPKLLERIAKSNPSVIGHNLETTPSLYPKVRGMASYDRSLMVLRTIKESNKAVYTKSGIILGLGEARKEVIEVFKDLRSVNCDFLTIGQYLAPSLDHYPVKEYLGLEDFQFFQDQAYQLGFRGVKSAPYVRSSYLAHTFLAAI